MLFVVDIILWTMVAICSLIILDKILVLIEAIWYGFVVTLLGSVVAGFAEDTLFYLKIWCWLYHFPITWCQETWDRLTGFGQYVTKWFIGSWSYTPPWPWGIKKNE